MTAALFIFMGVVTYGCSDSATVSEPAELGNLSVSTGTLQPPFNPATTAYTVQLSSDVSSTTINASPRVDGDTIRIDNQQTTSHTITLDSPGGEKSVIIVVTETGAGGGSKSYAVRVKRDLEDNSLQALSVSTGTLAPSPFEKDQLVYTVNNVAGSVTSVTISATKSNINTVMQIGSVTVPAGTASGQVKIDLIASGSSPPVLIDVTTLSGSKKTYTVIINRDASGNNFLESLSISPGNLNFKATNTVYDVRVANGVEKVTVTAKPQDSTASIAILVNGAVTNSQPITLLGPDSTTKIKIRVTAQNGKSLDYDINVKRAALNENNNLESLTVSPGSLKFDADQTRYTVRVGSSIDKITVMAEPQVSTSRLAIETNGVPVNNAQPITLLGPGSTTLIKIRVAAQNSQFKDYIINVDRDALGGNNNLSALSVTAGGVAQSLDVKADPPNYTVNVASTVSTVDISATKLDPSAVMSGDVTAGVGSTSGSSSIPLGGPGTSRVVSIAVSAPNQGSKTYTITVERAAQASNNNLQNLSVSPGPLTPAFTATITSYTVNVSSSITSVTVTATLQDTNASMEVEGQGTSSGQAREISLGDQGSRTTITIRVTPPNGNAKSYTITVDRAPNGDDENNGGKGKKGGNDNTKGNGNKGNNGGNRDDVGDDDD